MHHGCIEISHGATSFQSITASVKAWGALRIRKGFQMKATPGDELPTPKSLWELTLPVPINFGLSTLSPFPGNKRPAPRGIVSSANINFNRGRRLFHRRVYQTMSVNGDV